MSSKNLSRLRRAKKTRSNIRNQESPRLTVYRSSQHFYAQIFDSIGSKVIASASTTEKDLKKFFPTEQWNKLHIQIIMYARKYCSARGCFGLECPICRACYPKRKSKFKHKKP